ncbi:MAG: hypothetical protein HC899_23570 [Leptolyngbyaceae cyanobacterium SM1_4_3]|nr:hypothetical protein [Leptolyngbyaceae cyanobacterium SM1_4_3]
MRFSAISFPNATPGSELFCGLGVALGNLSSVVSDKSQPSAAPYGLVKTGQIWRSLRG